MALSPFVEKIEELDEQLRPFYVEGENGFVLDTDVTQHPGTRALKNALDQERKKAKEFRQEAERVKDVDLARWERLSTLSDDDLAAFETWKKTGGRKKQDASDTDEGDSDDAEYEKRLLRDTARMRDDHTKEIELRDGKIKELTEERSKLDADLRRFKIDQALISVATLKNANDPKDILLRATGIWQIDEDGTPTAFDENGDVIRGKDGVSKITMEEWVEGIALAAPYLFKESVGGGVAGLTRNGKASHIRTKADLKTADDKVAFISQHGLAAFEDLPVK